MAIQLVSPVNGQSHFFHTALDLVLSLHVSHGLCGLSIDGQDHVPYGEVGLGGFTAGRNLRKQ